MTFEITITPNDNGIKPKNFLKKALDVNYNQLLKALKNKRITQNGKKIKEDSILESGDIIKVWDDSIKLRKIEKKEIKKEDIKNLKMKTLFKHEDFLVLDKLSGVIVQGAFDNTLSLSKHLRFLEQKENLEIDSLFHVHRLDKDTSGCLVIGYGKENIRKLNECFQQKKVTKIYSAICCGWPKKKEDSITLNLDRNKPNTLPKVIMSKTGKPTKLKYKVIKEFEVNDERLSLIEIELITGFMHQIRVTLNHLGHAILGDEMYANTRINESFKNSVNRQLLHASSVELIWENKKIKVESELPLDFKEILQE